MVGLTGLEPLPRWGAPLSLAAPETREVALCGRRSWPASWLYRALGEPRIAWEHLRLTYVFPAPPA